MLGIGYILINPFILFRLLLKIDIWLTIRLKRLDNISKTCHYMFKIITLLNWVQCFLKHIPFDEIVVKCLELRIQGTLTSLHLLILKYQFLTYYSLYTSTATISILLFSLLPSFTHQSWYPLNYLSFPLVL